MRPVVLGQERRDQVLAQLVGEPDLGGDLRAPLGPHLEIPRPAEPVAVVSQLGAEAADDGRLDVLRERGEHVPQPADRGAELVDAVGLVGERRRDALIDPRDEIADDRREHLSRGRLRPGHGHTLS